MAHHPLADSWANLHWADERFEALKGRVEAFREGRLYGSPCLVVAEPQADTSELVFRISAVKPDPQFREHVGRVVQLLRDALDYLVHALAELDSGQPQDSTQFLIEDTSQGFKGKESFRLKGVNAPHRAAIEAVQPYNGGDWLALLRDLSNPHKHRHRTRLITVIDGQRAIQGRRLNDPVPRSVDKAGVTTPLPPADVYVYLYLSFDIALGDGTPVIDALERLKSEVRAFIQTFESEF